jgi:uncharacterized protein YwqG
MVPKTKEELNSSIEETRTKFIKITPVIDNDIPTKASKIGGFPYWKKSMLTLS